MEHTLPPLPYKLDALDPYISAETLTLHYSKHHRAYVTQLNSLINDTEFEEMNLEDIIKKSCGAMFNCAAEVWNHNFYWHCLRPVEEGSVTPIGHLAMAIEQEFGSIEQLRIAFNDMATQLFGSGWAWLVVNDIGELRLEVTRNAETPMMWSNKAPLLVCDMWEHAYYTDYRNVRADHLNAFWRLANWEFAEHSYAQQLNKTHQIQHLTVEMP